MEILVHHAAIDDDNDLVHTVGKLVAAVFDMNASLAVPYVAAVYVGYSRHSMTA
jgi:hypothetical protein